MDTISEAPTGVLLWLGAVLVGVIVGAVVARRRLMSATPPAAHDQAILDTIPVEIAILDGDGIIECCNAAWTRTASSRNPFVTAGPGQPWPTPDPGDTADKAAHQRITMGLHQLLARIADDTVIDYTWSDGAVQHWSQIHIGRFDKRSGAVIVTHVNTTRRQVLDPHTAAVLHELAHFNMREGMGEVVSTVAHEVTQPLAASLANAQALRRMIANPEADPGSLAAIVEDICDANRRARDIVDRIRSVMRKEPFKLEPLDVNHIVLDVVAVLNPAAEADRVLVVADVDPDLPLIVADHVQLRQVVMNLVLNAVHAARESTSPDPLVRVVTGLDGGQAFIDVEDNGPGVADGLDRLFEPYYTTKPGGLGMGLPISRSIVESLGGSINVSIGSAGGARFVVRLPLEGSVAPATVTRTS